MERRQLLAALGALSAGGASAVGTGAFTGASADRGFQVQVSGDASALLGIKSSSGPNSAYADTTSGGEFRVNLSPSNKNIGSGIAGGEGINPNSTTFIQDVFEIANQGTQEIEIGIAPLVFIKNEPGDLLIVFVVPLFPVDFTLGVGESQSFSLLVLSSESEPVDTSVQATLDIVAEAT